MIMTRFDPEIHGFHFSNAYIKWSAGPIDSTQLCGGMVYAALDYFYGKLTIPPDKAVPVEGSDLHNYIFDRQCGAHGSTLLRFGASYAPIIGPLFAESPAIRVQTQQNKLMTILSTGRPAAMCLVRQGHGHHVVAIGCDFTDSPIIWIYNPNVPDKVQTVQSTLRKGYHMDAKGSFWHGYFVDDNYQPEAPPILIGESNWRCCVKCRGLFYNGQRTNGVCPKGASHVVADVRTSYTLSDTEGMREPGWKWCYQCQGLYFAGIGSDGGICPAAVVHNPLGSKKEYSLARECGTGQRNWRRCKNCDVLFFAGVSPFGACRDNRPHDPAGSPNYVLPFA